MQPIKRGYRKKGRLSWESVSQALHSRTAGCVYVLLAGTLVLCLLVLVAITPERYDLKVGDIAHNTITASKDVVDEISTARQREVAAAGVEPTYVFKEGVSAEVMQNLNAVLKQAEAAQQYGSKLLEQYAQGNAARQRDYRFTGPEMQYAKSLMTLVTLADYQMDTLLRASDAQIKNMNDNLTAALENTLNTTIREQHVSESIQYLQQIIGYKTDMDMLQNVVTPILRKVVQPNMLIDQEATEKLREEARATVEPVIYKQGQNIVLARERVTANQLEMLRSLGLLDNDDVDVVMYLGGVLQVLLAMLVLVIALVLLSPATLKTPKHLIIIMSILCVTIGVTILGQMINVYLSPVLMGAMMLASLIGPSVGMAGCLSLAVMVSALLTGGDTSYASEIANLLFTSFISGMLVILVIRHKPFRQQILLSGILAALSNMLVILTIGFLTNTSIGDVFTNALWSACGALIASVLCVAVDPMVETVFHLATPSKLLELSNPNHPLLRRLLIEASGTYHHSIIVANLAEAAAEVVGANPLLARTGAYFHDIGKLKRPMYFKENQMGENPHEHTNPYVSAAIVTAHTRDGLIMAQQARLPQEIQDVILEHHGDTPVVYFYHKAMQEADGQPVDIADFRYDGKRPRSKESAIIMLADTVEAAVRSMPDPTPQAIEAFIAKLVRGKIDDGQLEDAPLTMRDITAICTAFSTVLRGVFHERIEYPAISPAAAARVAARLPKAEEARGESQVEQRELRRVITDVGQAERAAEEAVAESEEAALAQKKAEALAEAAQAAKIAKGSWETSVPSDDFDHPEEPAADKPASGGDAPAHVPGDSEMPAPAPKATEADK